MGGVVFRDPHYIICLCLKIFMDISSWSGNMLNSFDNKPRFCN